MMNDMKTDDITTGLMCLLGKGTINTINEDRNQSGDYEILNSSQNYPRHKDRW